ncbi:MAG: peptidylprolyl isomerase, partial [Lysobacterales bacterium]
MLAVAMLGLAVFALPGARAQALPPSDDSLDRIVAVVNDDVILKSELDRALANIQAQYGAGGQLPDPEVLGKQVMQRLIVMQLQVQRANETGIRITDAEFQQSLARLAEQNGISVDQMAASLQQQGLSPEEFRRAFRDELLAQRLRQRYTQSQVNVTDTEIENVLASGTLKSGDVRLAHIVVSLPENADALQVQAAATKIETAAREIAGGADFAAAAIKYSDGPQALEGGDLGWRSYDEVPELFSEAVTTLTKGEVSRPMRGPSGFHLLKLVDQRDSERTMAHEYHARHILIRPSELVTEEEAEQTIRDLHARLSKGDEFGKLAREFSD